MFNNDLIELPKLVRLDGETRYYETPTGEKYPSVTSVLDKTSDKSNLHRWRKRIGEDEAAKITKRASTRGTNIHTLCEKFVLNQDLDRQNIMPTNMAMFKQLEQPLKQYVDNIRVTEGSLFSHKLKIAGSVDLVAMWKGRKAIIDFKTSMKNKRIEWIENYFLQASMYSFMLWEMTGLEYTDIVIMIAVEEESQPQIFEDRAANWIDKARAKCIQYHSMAA